MNINDLICNLENEGFVRIPLTLLKHYIFENIWELIEFSPESCNVKYNSVDYCIYKSIEDDDYQLNKVLECYPYKNYRSILIFYIPQEKLNLKECTMSDSATTTIPILVFYVYDELKYFYRIINPFRNSISFLNNSILKNMEFFN